MATSILLVEPDEALAAELAAAIGAHGVRVDVARGIDEALLRIGRTAPSALLLDLDGLDDDPIDALRQARTQGPMPIVVIGSSVDEVEQIVALELGADDFVAKPVTARLLLARVRSRLRRASPAATAAGPSRLRVDAVEREAYFDGRALPLPPSEFDLLRALTARVEGVVERRHLARLLGGDGEAGLRNVDSTVCRLRKRLAAQGAEAVSIRAVSGVGYRLSIDGTASPIAPSIVRPAVLAAAA